MSKLLSETLALVDIATSTSDENSAETADGGWSVVGTPRVDIQISFANFGICKGKIMKKNTKMSATKVKLETRISARVPNTLYVAAKFVASCQGVTMEEKIADLLRKDIAAVTSQKWFTDMAHNQDAGDMAVILGLFKKKPGGESLSDEQFSGDWKS